MSQQPPQQKQEQPKSDEKSKRSPWDMAVTQIRFSGPMSLGAVIPSVLTTTADVPQTASSHLRVAALELHPAGVLVTFAKDAKGLPPRVLIPHAQIAFIALEA